jgi:MOSC domain-containing protein YiiM
MSFDNPMATVVSLHIHGDESGGPMATCDTLHLVAGLGIEEDRRYFAKKSRMTGQPRRRQVTLIDRETIAEHAATLGLPALAPGRVKSNIETLGVPLIDWLGRDVCVGTAVVRFYEPRTPCRQMDAICTGLRALMENNRQGVIAEVLQSGVVRVGDVVRLSSGALTACV